jgi:hypothetical protein
MFIVEFEKDNQAFNVTVNEYHHFCKIVDEYGWESAQVKSFKEGLKMTRPSMPTFEN